MTDHDFRPATLLAGLAVGTVIALGNLAAGLSSGLWDSGQVTASLLSFVALALLLRGRATPRDTQLSQTFACAAGAMPAVLGLLGVVPALGALGRAPGLLALLGAGLALGTLGLLVALLLYQRMVVDEALPFPSGAAAAALISTLHADAAGGGAQQTRSRARALLGAGAFAGAVVVVRDGIPKLLGPIVPGALLLPGALFGVPAATLGVGVALGPLLAGIGAVAGLAVGASIGLGALLQAALGHHLLAAGQRTEANLGEWLLWPGVSLIVSASVVELLAMSPALLRGVRDLAASRASGAGRRLPPWLLVLPPVVLFFWGVQAAFGLGPLVSLVALAVTPLFCAMVGRAAGQADFAPISQAGQTAQVTLGRLFSLDVPRDLGVGAVVSGAVAQTGTVLWSFKSGERLGVPLRALGLAALAGTAWGALVSLTGFALLQKAGALGGARFPAPSAAQFQAVAAVVVSGGEAIPGAMRSVCVAAALLGVLLALLGRTRAAPLLPSPVAMGVGVLLPFSASAAVLLGAAAAYTYRRWWPESAALRLPALGAGLIAGESLVAFALAALGALR